MDDSDRTEEEEKLCHCRGMTGIGSKKKNQWMKMGIDVDLALQE